MKDDLISRSALLKILCNSCDGWCDNTECDCLNCKSDHRCDMVVDIAEAPALDAETVIKSMPYVKEALEMAKQSLEPVQHGRWELVTTKCVAGKYVRVGYCQNCKEERIVDNYCFNCGAKMDGDDHDQA